MRVTVPAEARSGVHLAGISVLVPGSANSAGAAAGGAGASVFVQSHRIIAVQVNLPGPADPELVITGVTPVARPDGLYLALALVNTGRELTKGEGVQLERYFVLDDVDQALVGRRRSCAVATQRTVVAALADASGSPGRPTIPTSTCTSCAFSVPGSQ